MDLGRYKGTFNIKNNTLGFEYGKEYKFELDKRPNQPYDITEDSGLYICLSSETSINRYFNNLKRID